MRLVAYLRLSSDTQLDGWGIDRQRAAIKTWAKRNGHTIVAEHSDVITGKADAVDRPGLTNGGCRVRMEGSALVAAGGSALWPTGL